MEVDNEYLRYVFSLSEFQEEYLLPIELEDVLLTLYMDDEPHPFVFVDHWRGRGCHLDHRWLRGTKKGGLLDGMTVAHMKAGIAKEDIRTLKQAAEMAKHDEYWKISNEPGPLRMFATPKKPEPYEWLTYEGVVPPREINPDVPGSTRFEWGVFYIRDKGVQYYGAQKPYFKEFFLYGKKYTGRWIYRMIQRQKPEGARAVYLFLFGKPKDQTPYVLSSRAVKEGWVPPFGVSCLPPEIRKKIPKEYQYWKVRGEQQRLEVRNKLVEWIKKNKVDITVKQASEEEVPFVLQHHAFKKKGKKPIRAGYTDEHWDLRILKSKKPVNIIHLVLTQNPITYDAPIAAFEKPCTDLSSMTKEGYIPPGTPEWNPGKETQAWVFILDKGKAIIYEDSEMFKKFELRGEKLKGLFTWTRETKGQSIGVFERSKTPKG